MVYPALLTAVDSTSHIHIVVGSNAVAGARCTQSLDVGATVKLIAPESAEIPYSAARLIDGGRVEWIRRHFDDGDLTCLGREEIDGVVDAVFVTLRDDYALGQNAEARRTVTVTMLMTL